MRLADLALLAPLCLVLPLTAGCDLCWVRGEAMSTCPDDDDAGDDDDTVDDDDTADDDDTVDDDDASDDDDSADDDDASDDDDDATPDPCEGAETELTVGAVTIPVVCVKPGSFQMGSPTSEPGRNQDEEQHEAVLTRAFVMTTTEVTQSAFFEVTDLSPSDCIYGCGDARPVQNVSWSQALEFANELSSRTGHSPACVVAALDTDTTCDFESDGWRLATETEWEYAARAGEYHLYSGSDVLGDVGWCPGPGPDYVTLEVGQLQANAWGLFDMSGNVAEWVWDRYGDYPVAGPPDPTGPDSGSFRVHRGGAFPVETRFCRAANRSDAFGTSPNWNRGFRVVRTLP
jgi:formylglycine-generating enzyme required for sulfatase activity